MLTRQRFHIIDPHPPANHRKEREMGSILSDILKQEKPVAPIPEQMGEYWQIAAGQQIATHTDPEAINDGILLVNVDHPGWLAEVRRLPKQRLLKKLNAVTTLPEIRDIRFRLDPSLRTKGRYK